MKIYAVIPTGNRESEYSGIIDWCDKNNVTPITIATTEEAFEYSYGETIRSNEMNISKWWNMGLKRAYSNGADVVLVLNDDVVLGERWLSPVLAELEGKSGASGARHRTMIQGYAFALNAKDKIYADEEMVWYFSDDAVQQRCIAKNGFGVVRGLDVPNKYARSSEAFMGEQIAKDRVLYTKKYNRGG